ncbi:putative tyrosinase central domain protein [Drepanopeziza brunnea f. sp. 'multigermtubi' MB_m1]|uniref:Putative tyrosinase central domain protein n=1 Tax=Marssonina brunnea f. sp. multigermtubi (strain MB_m1) TaxID=1072389 RepID=K1XMQ0_MARBU|nr:putative tyrosinase central domain protein [Drepanopeziza brunnea f. sp. 'multigermtubi' MB_m1]EKD21813.1 putative tyrosinase central domain protein [Drepanopeziza brunnea f. sp. 'multigermtubi' MB_m1]
MRLQFVVNVALIVGATVARPVMDSNAAAHATLDNLASIARRNQDSFFFGAYMQRPNGKTCTKSNMLVRKEWGSLSSEERIAYTDAVLCFQKKAPLTPTSLIPGVRSRYDDFVGTHINQTQNIHYTGTFLAWHRYFTWMYEKALRDECGYTGAQPYWNWGLFSNDTTSGPVFDGSATSMSGNGLYIPGRGDLTLALPGHRDVLISAANGGGCVSSGPFKNMTVNLGPSALPLNGGKSQTGSGLDYNPRCLTRDISSKVNDKFANATAILDLITENWDIDSFQTVLQGVPGSGSLGVHGGGHFTIAGDPAADGFASPGDPAFYLHHSMVDRVWWMWQMQDPKKRLKAISGTGTFLNIPPSPNTTLETPVDMGYAATPGYGPVAMKDLMSITAGPFCYTYDSL